MIPNRNFHLFNETKVSISVKKKTKKKHIYKTYFYNFKGYIDYWRQRKYSSNSFQVYTIYRKILKNSTKDGREGLWICYPNKVIQLCMN